MVDLAELFDSLGGWSASPELNLKPSCRGGKGWRLRVSSQQLGPCVTQRWRLLYLSGGAQGDLFSSGRENRKIIVHTAYQADTEVSSSCALLRAHLKGLQRTDVFFSKRITATVSLLVSRVFSLLV